MDHFTMHNTDLQEELLSTLAGLRADIPADLITIRFVQQGREGCIRCRFSEYLGGEARCSCRTGVEEDGLDALASSPLLLSMTLMVQANSTGTCEPLYIGYGWNQEEDDPPQTGYLLIAPGGKYGLPVFGRWPAGFFRMALVSTIYDIAASCGCSVIKSDGEGHYVRTDTNEPLCHCCTDDLWAEEAYGPDWEADRGDLTVPRVRWECAVGAFVPNEAAHPNDKDVEQGEVPPA